MEVEKCGFESRVLLKLIINLSVASHEYEIEERKKNDDDPDAAMMYLILQ